MPAPADKLLDRDAARALRQRLRASGLRLVLTNGCFDLLHPGHVRLLEEARGLGDFLLVAANADLSVRRLKGPTRPIVPERERAEVLAALRAVDAVVLFAEETPQELIDDLLPDVLVKGSDWDAGAIVGREAVEAAGGRVVRLPLTGGFSTTAIVTAVREGPAALG